MRRKRVHLWALRELEQLRALGSITLCFTMGSVAGSWCSAFLGQEGAGALREWLEGYVSLSQSAAGGWRWLSVLWQMLRLPLLISLLQFSVLGMLLIPAVMGVRGFLFSFAVTGFVRTYAWRGMLCALLLFAPLGVLEMTALFLLSVAAFLHADRMGREGRGVQGPKTAPVMIAAAWCVLVLTAAAQVLLSDPLSGCLASVLK